MLFFAGNAVSSQFDARAGFSLFETGTTSVRSRHRVLIRGMRLRGRVRSVLMARMKRKHGRHDDFGPGGYGEQQERRDGFLQHASS